MTQRNKPRPGAHLKPVRNDSLLADWRKLESHLLKNTDIEQARVFRQHFIGPIRFNGKCHKFAVLLVGPPGVGKTLYGQAMASVHGPHAVTLTAEQAATPGYELPPDTTYLQIDDLTVVGRVERTANIRRWLDGTVCIYLTSNHLDVLDLRENDPDFMVFQTPGYAVRKPQAGGRLQ